MSTTELFEKAKGLPPAKRIELAELLWESAVQDGHDPGLTSEQLAELDRRAENALAHPERCRSLDEVMADIEKRSRSRR